MSSCAGRSGSPRHSASRTRSSATCPALKAADGTTEFVVVVARKDIVREYEAACEAAGAQAGLVDLTTFNVVNAVLASPQPPAGDWLLVHVTPDDATMAILRGNALVFFRNRVADGEARARRSGAPDGDVLRGSSQRRRASTVSCLPEAARRPAAERRTPTICAAPSRIAWARRVDAIDPRNAATLLDRITANAELLDTLAPLVGLLARERAA